MQGGDAAVEVEEFFLCPVCEARKGSEEAMGRHLAKRHGIDTRTEKQQQQQQQQQEQLLDGWVVMDISSSSSQHVWPHEALLSRALDASSDKKRVRAVQQLLRRAVVPPSHWPQLWRALIALQRLAAARGPNFVDRQYGLVFGAAVPEDFVQLPTFGADWGVCSWYLDDAQMGSAKRLLSIVSHNHPEIQWCPALCALCCLLLSFLPSEEDVLLSLEFMLPPSNALFAAKAMLHLLSPTLARLKQLAAVVARLSLLNLSAKAQAVLQRWDALAIGDIVEQWLATFFAALPYVYRGQVLFLWQLEGISAILRISMALLSHCLVNLHRLPPERGPRAQQFFAAGCDSVLSAIDEDAWLHVLHEASDYSSWALRSGKVNGLALNEQQIAVDAVRALQEESDLNIGVVTSSYQRPMVEHLTGQTQTLGSESDWDFLFTCLPERHRHYKPRMLFASRTGWAWRSFIRACLSCGAGLCIVALTAGRMTLGAVVPKGLLPSREGLLHSDREACVFACYDGAAAANGEKNRSRQVWRWSLGAPDYAAMWTQESLAIGIDAEGTQALFFEQSLETVDAANCGVFRNKWPCKGQQKLLALEVYKWGP